MTQQQLESELTDTNIGYAVKQRVWRLETLGGKGVYTSGALRTILGEDSDEHQHCISRPGPYDDFGFSGYCTHCVSKRLYGFVTRYQLLTWFKLPILKKLLASKQIKLKSFIANEVWFTKNQCVWQ